MRWRAGAAALAVVVSTAITGCSDTARPTPIAPITSSSAGPSVAPSRAAATPAVPSVAPLTEIRALGRRYYEVVEKAYRTLDTTELRSISHPECGGCRGQIEKVENFKRMGQRVVSPNFQVALVRARVTGDASGDATIRATFSGGRIVDRSGREVMRMENGTAVQRLTIARIGERWLVTAVLGVA